MPKPRLFVGSSQKNLTAARVFAKCLKPRAEVKVWDEGFFLLNQGVLETLLESPKQYDFAVFVLAPDDLTTSAVDTLPSPRDNVLFESGLFMGVLGRARVFLVYDQAVELKIPSDFAGITLAPYDGARIHGSESAAAVRTACRLITERITEARYPHLVGPWKSMYPMTFKADCRLCEEEVEISASGNGVAITTTTSAKDDPYTAFGRLPRERQIIGEWKSRQDRSDTSGVFVLNVSPDSACMYGYFTSPDKTGGVAYASWVLAKMSGADEATIKERLREAQGMLTTATIALPKMES